MSLHRTDFKSGMGTKRNKFTMPKDTRTAFGGKGISLIFEIRSIEFFGVGNDIFLGRTELRNVKIL